MVTYCVTKIIPTCSSVTYPGYQRGFFFVAKLRLWAAKPLILPREKKTLWTRQLQTSLPCELVSISVVDWSLYLVPSLSAWWWSNTGFHWINHCKVPQEQWKPVYWLEETVNRQCQFGNSGEFERAFRGAVQYALDIGFAEILELKPVQEEA